MKVCHEVDAMMYMQLEFHWFKVPVLQYFHCLQLVLSNFLIGCGSLEADHWHKNRISINILGCIIFVKVQK